MFTYPPGHEPDFWDPVLPVKEHRFALGRVALVSPGKPPLVVLGMNPSYADDQRSDKTINRIIEASVHHGYSGWVMLNLYPERATSPDNLAPFDQQLSTSNCNAMEAVLTRFGVTAVLGAWGNPPNQTIRAARKDVLSTLKRLNVQVFSFDALTAEGHPRHPTPRGGRLLMTGPKHYLNW